MAGHTHLYRRGARYYYRGRVPHDLVAVLGKQEVKFSLNTADRREALVRVREKAVGVDRMFAEARRRRDAKAVSEVPEAELERIAREVYARELSGHEEYLREHPDYDRETVEIGLDAEFETWEWGLRENEWSRDADDRVSDVLEAHGLRLPPDSKSFASARRLIARAIAAANRTALRRAGGDHGFQFDDPLVAGGVLPAVGRRVQQAVRPGTPDSEPLSAMLRRWEAETQPPEKTLHEWRRAVRRWEELHGDTPVGEITTVQVSRFKDVLLQAPARPPHDIRALPLPKLVAVAKKRPDLHPVSAKAVNKTLGAIQSVLSYAKRNGYIEINPASGVSVVVPRREMDKARRPFTDTELQAVLEAARQSKRAADRWLPVLGAFMGARLSALGRPAASDVRVEGDEAHLQIWKDKTETGRRRIPIHPTIIKLGFMDYVRSLPEDGPLFPGFNPPAYTKRFGRLLDSICLIDPALVFHSLRHGYKDACRAAGISEEVHDALTGHAGGGVGRSYGRGVPLQVLEEAVKKIEYRGLDLSRL